MKFLVLALVLLVAVNARSYTSSDEAFFKDWMKRHNRNYENIEEYMKRFNNWLRAYEYVLKTNSEQNNFRVHLNEFADMDNEEFRYYYTGLIPRKEAAKNVKILSTDNLPSSIDWTQKGAVTNVKNQGQCGSCWAFSTTGSLEGLHFIKENSLLSFSEQQLVDCSGSYGNLGCDGGLMDDAFKYVEAKGIELESTYPYTAQDGTCQYDASQVKFKNTGYQDVSQDDETQLKAAVAQQPTSVAVDGGSYAFQLYSGGILTSYCGTQLDHGVLAVGYGTSSGQMFWKVKNSWGASWGEEGFIRLKRTESQDNGECGIAMQPSYPTYN